MRTNLLYVARLLVPAVVLVSQSSCSLTDWKLGKRDSLVEVKKGAPLQTGVKYEVRKALTAGVPFRPADMKRYYFVLESSKPPLMTAQRPTSNMLNVRTTAYCHDESDHIVYGTKSAVGTPLRFGTVRSAAADWSRFPVGTRFRIANQPNVIYEVDDYGSALVGTGTIDLYKPTQGMMNDWGVRHVNIEVLQWGSYERSMKLMEDRLRWPHVRKMMEGIQTKLYQTKLNTPMTPVTAMLEPSKVQMPGLSPSM